MNLDQIYREIKTARQHSAALYFEARKSLVQQQNLLVESFEVLDNALAKLQVAEKELRQQSEDLATARQAVATQRQRYENLLEFVPEAYLVTDKTGIIREANRTAAALFNIPHRFLAGKPLAMLVAQEQRRLFLGKLSKLHGQCEQKWKICLQPRDGEIFEAIAQVATISNHGGELVAVEWILRPMSEQQLDSSLWLFKDAMQQVNESIVITSAQLDEPGPNIMFVNPSFTRMTGYTPEEITGKTPRILQGAKTERSFLERLRHNLSQGQSFQGETINYRKDGTEYQVELSCSPIQNESGEITHYVSIQRDITLKQGVVEAQCF